MKVSQVCLLLAVMVTGSGCYTLRDSVDDVTMSTRNQLYAEVAWLDFKPNCYDVDHQRHFGAGFRAGYASVASGGNGCPPTMPPRNYWTILYQNPEGQKKMLAWFLGYSYGATVAAQHGVADSSQILTSSTLRDSLVRTQEEVPTLPHNSNATQKEDWLHRSAPAMEWKPGQNAEYSQEPFPVPVTPSPEEDARTRQVPSANKANSVTR